MRWIASSSFYPWLIVGTVCIGAFLGQLDASIAGLVLPTLETSFGAPLADVEWVAIAYLLILAALVVPFGRLSDLAGRKMLYTSGFLIFILGSALCGLAPDLTWLIVFRVLQAIGAAMLQANSVAIITAAVDRRRLGRAIGIQGAAQAIGLSIGPSVGGFLIDALDWRWVFFIAVPFGLLGTLIGWLVLPRTNHAAGHAAHRTHERFDWPGALLLGPAIALFLLALTFANTWAWTSPRMLLVSVLAVGCLAVFLAAERWAASPLVDFTLFCSRLFSMGIVSGLLSYAVLFGSLFLVPFYLERTLGETAAQTGLLMSPIPVALGIMAPIAGVLTDRVGSRVPTVLGMGMSTAALLCLALLHAPSMPVMLAMLAFLGAGLGLFTPPNNSAIMGSAPTDRLGTAGGILNMTRSLGTSLGVALTGAILGLLLSTHSGQRVVSTLNATPGELQVAFHGALLFLALVAGLAAALSAARGASATQQIAAKHSVATDSIGV
ncbi:MAG: MFS transporter [Mycobacterium sp.]